MTASLLSLTPLAAAVSQSTIALRWWVALAIAAVVLVVVVVLLEGIRRSARRIHQGVSDIWTGGTHIAANTVTIAQLQRTNFVAGMLLEAAAGIAQAAERIRAVVAPQEERRPAPPQAPLPPSPGGQEA